MRPRHPDSPNLRAYRGTPCYPPDPGWVLPGRFEPYPAPDGEGAVGEVVFSYDGSEHRLVAWGEDDDSLWILFRDATSGVTTYPANRQLAAPSSSGTAPCAWTSTGRSTCPAPTPTSPPVRCPRRRTRCRSRSRRASRRRRWPSRATIRSGRDERRDLSGEDHRTEDPPERARAANDLVERPHEQRSMAYAGDRGRVCLRQVEPPEHERDQPDAQRGVRRLPQGLPTVRRAEPPGGGARRAGARSVVVDGVTLRTYPAPGPPPRSRL